MPNLKQRIKSGEALVGAFVMIPSPAVVEMLGYAGFDFAILDSEHGGSSVESIEHQLRAAQLAGLPALVRTVGMSPGEILRVLDAGAEGIVVPHVKTEAEARAIVSAAHYPPHGTRGIATTARAGRHGFVTLKEHLQDASDRILVVPQIEDKEALANVKAIASLDGVDGLFIGPADLSMSLGQPGNPAHPVVSDAIDGIVRDVRDAGKIPMIFTKSADEVFSMRDRQIGVSIYSTTVIIASAFKDVIAGIKKGPTH